MAHSYSYTHVCMNHALLHHAAHIYTYNMHMWHGYSWCIQNFYFLFMVKHNMTITIYTQHVECLYIQNAIQKRGHLRANIYSAISQVQIPENSIEIYLMSYNCSSQLCSYSDYICNYKPTDLISWSSKYSNYTQLYNYTASCIYLV